MKQGKKPVSLMAVATFQVLTSGLWLVATILDCTDMGHFHPRGKFYYSVLIEKECQSFLKDPAQEKCACLIGWSTRREKREGKEKKHGMTHGRKLLERKEKQKSKQKCPGIKTQETGDRQRGVGVGVC